MAVGPGRIAELTSGRLRCGAALGPGRLRASANRKFAFPGQVPRRVGGDLRSPVSLGRLERPVAPSGDRLLEDCKYCGLAKGIELPDLAFRPSGKSRKAIPP